VSRKATDAVKPNPDPPSAASRSSRRIVCRRLPLWPRQPALERSRLAASAMRCGAAWSAIAGAG